MKRIGYILWAIFALIILAALILGGAVRIEK
jgi:hypothetical protein